MRSAQENPWSHGKANNKPQETIVQTLIDVPIMIWGHYTCIYLYDVETCRNHKPTKTGVDLVHTPVHYHHVFHQNIPVSDSCGGFWYLTARGGGAEAAGVLGGQLTGHVLKVSCEVFRLPVLASTFCNFLDSEWLATFSGGNMRLGWMVYRWF